jgi:hypothetical protein
MMKKTAIALAALSLSAAAQAYQVLPGPFSTPTFINFTEVQDPVNGPGNKISPPPGLNNITFTFTLPAAPMGFTGWLLDGVIGTSNQNSFSVGPKPLTINRCGADCNSFMEVAGATYSTESAPNDIIDFRFDAGFVGPGDYLVSFTITNTHQTAFNMFPQFDAIAAVPEPSTYALMLAGLGVVGWMAKRRQKKAEPELQAA